MVWAKIGSRIVAEPNGAMKRMSNIPSAIHGVTHTQPSFAVPAGATDCHVHVFGPGETFPWSPSRVYTPGDASVESLLAHQAALNLSRVVVVHPSPYGTDNACTLDALRRLGPRARGVAVIDPATITDAELVAMQDVGIRGCRANLQTGGVSDPHACWDILRHLRDRISPLGWHVQVFTSLAIIEALHDRLMDFGVMLVVDHFGGAKSALGIGQPGFAALVSLAAKGQAYVKLSAAYRVSAQPDAADVLPLAQALIKANPDRMLWGSDWPHPGGAKREGALRDEIEPFHAVDDGAALNRLVSWAGGDATMLRRILVDNPARLYGF